MTAAARGHAPPPTDRLRQEQLDALRRNGPVGCVSALFGAAVLAALVTYLGSLDGSLVAIDRDKAITAGIWVAIMGFEVICHLRLCRAYRRARPAGSAWRGWAPWFVAIGLAEGLTWSLGGLTLMYHTTTIEELLVLLVSTGVAAGSVFAFGSYMPAFYAMFLATMLPYAPWAVSFGDFLHYALAALVTVFSAAIILLARRSNATFIEAVELRFANLDLALDLGREKEAAEKANRAKSSFLAAASHDLRQPIHALTLFVGALRGQRMSAEVRRLVEYVDESATAMEGLFNALLDISRLDAGEVKTYPTSFLIQPMLERIMRDHESEAAAKGLRLVLQPCSAAVETDPILLERILRNIVSNAVRYTDRGRILIGCRRRAGLAIQVWDTGRGIPADQQDRVFEEFVQLGNPERDRAAGLGLGLAIVKHLTALLGCPLKLDSVPGRGSVFTLTVPLAAAAPSPVDSARSTPVATPRRELILVIDDELAIQEGMRQLLAGWGYAVIAAGSGPEILARTADCPTRPSLIICDYRLRGGANGLAVIESLQAEYNDEIPALLITGDTAPDRVAEAERSAFPLLHKPVSNAALQAAIARLVHGVERSLPA